MQSTFKAHAAVLEGLRLADATARLNHATQAMIDVQSLGMATGETRAALLEVIAEHWAQEAVAANADMRAAESALRTLDR